MNNPIYLIHTPTDEETHGGCIGAGRGFVHVTPEGDLTACPVSNLATHNLVNSSLEEGLSNLLFKEFRENEKIHNSKDESCALLVHSTETDLSKDFGAYSTSVEDH
jgi:MoaA/NifB/PqqE/SkfB family radical SAM enzyme